MVVQAGLYGAHVLAEAKHHAELVGLHAEEPRERPAQHEKDDDDKDANRTNAAAGQKRLQAVLALVLG